MTLDSNDSDFRIGPYRVIRHIAQGGTSAVYEVEDRGQVRRYALKLCAPEDGKDSRLIEIHRTLGRIPHSGIVASHAVGNTPDGRCFQLLDLVQGVPAQVFAKNTGVPGSSVRTTAVITAAIRLAEALDHIHQHGIIHRDIKSSNVMVRDDNSACLIDFGASILPGQPHRPGHFVGTYCYAPPEQIRGDSLDGRADIYAMGVLLYRMLGGRLPFEAADTEALINLHMNSEPPPLGSRFPGVPPLVVNLTMSMLEKQRTNRPANAGEVARALRGA